MPVRYACTCESTHLRMKCYLSILARGDCIEVSFNDGDPPGGAESQRICEEGTEKDGLSAFVPGRVDTIGSGPNIMA